MRIVFMGTPDFAVPSLELLLQKHTVSAVFTQPDKPKGRGGKLAFSPVKEVALANGIPVYQPRSLKEPEWHSILSELQPELIVVVAFGQILPVSILELPPKGCINVHGSLLPQYRGAAPIQWAILNGETETGITTMYMAKGMDTGDMLLRKHIPIAPDETYGSLYETMRHAGASLLIETLDALEEGTLQRIPQEDAQATYAPMLTREMERVCWEKSTQEILCLLRGLSPAPGAYTTIGDMPVKLWQAKAEDATFPGAVPGTLVALTKKGPVIATGDGAILLQEVQPQGKKRMPASDYLRGHPLPVGFILE